MKLIPNLLAFYLPRRFRRWYLYLPLDAIGLVVLLGLAICVRASFISGDDFFREGTVAPDAERQFRHLHAVLEKSRASNCLNFLDGYSDLCGFSSEWVAGFYVFYSMDLFELFQVAPEKAKDYREDLDLCARGILRVPGQVTDAKLASFFATRDYRVNSAINAGYIGIVLGTRKLVFKDTLYDMPMKQNAEGLVSDINRCLDHSNQVWSSDQATQLYAIWLYDQATGQNHAALFKRWESVMKERFLERKTGLLYSNIATSPDRNLSEPLGSSIGWTALFLVDVMPEFARDQYQRMCRYREKRYFSLAGISEHPSYNPFCFGDTDSGPLILGMGPSATGEAFCCHKLYNDPARFTRILRVFEVFGSPRRDGNRMSYYHANALGDAIVLYGKIARPRYPRNSH
jgi:hypothetical protein